MLNQDYEAGREEDQTSFAIQIKSGELVELGELVERQRRLETRFEAAIMQLAEFEKVKVREFEAEDAKIVRELDERKEALAA